MFDIATAAIERQIGEKEQMLPVIHAMYEDGKSIVIGMVWENATEKSIGLSAIRETFKRTGVIAYAVTIEAWMATENLGGETLADRKKRGFVPPSERPDRKECYLAFATDGSEQQTRVWDIERDWKGAVKAIHPRDMPVDMSIEGTIPNLLR
jgi:hypothetical protein